MQTPGEQLRSVYSRLRSHFQFANEKKLFSDVDHHTAFSVNIYCRDPGERKFDHIANLYTPATVDATFAHNGVGDIPGLEDEEGKWNTNGHRSPAATGNGTIGSPGKRSIHELR